MRSELTNIDFAQARPRATLATRCRRIPRTKPHTPGDGGQGGNSCYFATLNSTNTDDISDNNNNFDGAETVDLSGVYAIDINGPCTRHLAG